MTARGDPATRGGAAGRRLRLPRPRLLALVLLTAMFGVLLAEAVYPFEPELPVVRRTTPLRTATSGVRFDGGSALLAPSPAPWLVGIREVGRLEVDLEVRAGQPRQEGPARILSLSRDVFRANLMIGQRRDDLVVRVNRPGSDAAGDPPFVVPHLLGDRVWHRVLVRIADDRLVVSADDRTEVDAPLGEGAVGGWDSTFSLTLGDERYGGRGWVGEVRAARLVTPQAAVDLLGPGVLEPERGVVVRSRVRALFRSGEGDPFLIVAARVAAFLPLGVALRALLRRALPALLWIAGMAALLLVAKVFAAGRHPSLVDTLWSILGGLVGFLSADLFTRVRAERGA